MADFAEAWATKITRKPKIPPTRPPLLFSTVYFGLATARASLNSSHFNLPEAVVSDR